MDFTSQERGGTWRAITDSVSVLNSRRIIVVGGGAAGVFAAIATAEAAPEFEVLVLEKSPHFLAKVRISGGGRCNVTHACFDPREFTRRYPRGEKELIGPFQRFSARDTVAWFESRGARLKTESDGRMFPITDSSQTIIDCLLSAAKKVGAKLRANCGVESVARKGDEFELVLSNGEKISCDRLLLATGGCRAAALGSLAVSLGHTLETPVPSLFTFHIQTKWLQALAGVSIECAEVSVMGTKLCERGPILVTHWGLSGPAVLRLSAWGARALHEVDYKFPLVVDWLPNISEEQLVSEFRARREGQGARLIVNAPIGALTARLWEALVSAAGIERESRWASMTRVQEQQLKLQLKHTEFLVTGKSLNKDEFVTCGGVRLREVNFKTMESRVCRGLYFAGELLDLDGITGGFNFQAAWTTGWIAGSAMAE